MTYGIPYTPSRFPDAPARIKALPVNVKGFPIPFFAANGDVRVASAEAIHRAVKFDACWICGDRLGAHRAYVIGPMCSVNRISAEPGSHRECAIFAAENCPFLANPEARRNGRNLPEAAELPGGVPILRNPGVCAVWISKGPPRRVPDGNGALLFDVGEPVEVLWYAGGELATPEQVLEGILTGMPALCGLAAAEAKREGNLYAVKALRDQTILASRHWPLGDAAVAEIVKSIHETTKTELFGKAD